MSEPDGFGLDRLNAAGVEEARAVLRACCVAPAWVEALVSGRPYADATELLAASDRAVAALDDSGLAEAMAGHPRIGERADGPGSAGWSRSEQAGAAAASDRTAAELAAAQPAVRGAVRSRLPGERRRPQRPGAARDPAEPPGQRPGDRARHRPLGAGRHQPRPADPPAEPRGRPPMSNLTTHVLDAALGRPAVGVAVRLLSADGAELARGRTDDDGRVPGLVARAARRRGLPSGLRHRRLPPRDRSDRLLPGGHGDLHGPGPAGAASRAAAALAVRLLDLPGELSHGHRAGTEPVRQGGEPGRPDLPRHPAARDPRRPRVDLAARRLHGRALRRRPVRRPADGQPEADLLRLRQGEGHRRRSRRTASTSRGTSSTTSSR